MNAESLRKNLAGWREWEINPIVIKELRQAVRSWTVTGMLLLLLAVVFITSLVFLVQQNEINENNTGLGGEMFSAFMVILIVASSFFIPLYVGVRVALERQENNPDLFYVSTLSPGRIIRGKFLGGSYMALLFFSACMPFMAFTNLLRGVDLPTIFFALFCLFLVVSAANMGAIFLACWPVSRPFKVLLALYGVIQMIVLTLSMARIGFDAVHFGLGSRLAEGGFWMLTLTYVSLGLLVIGLFYFLAVALISPLSANRALPLRIYLTVVWLLGGALAWGWYFKNKQAGTILVWTIFDWTDPSICLMLAALLVVVSGSDNLSIRVRRAIPEPLPLRALAFLFYNGAAGGLLWVTGILGATVFLRHFVSEDRSNPGSVNDMRAWMAVVLYALDYSLCALFLQRRFFPRRPPKLTGLIATFLAAAAAIGPGVVLFFLNRLSWKAVEGLQLGNPFNVFAVTDASDRLNHLVFALGFLALMLLLNARWFFRQWRNFQPPPVAPPRLE